MCTLSSDRVEQEWAGSYSRLGYIIQDVPLIYHTHTHTHTHLDVYYYYSL